MYMSMLDIVFNGALFYLYFGIAVALGFRFLRWILLGEDFSFKRNNKEKSEKEEDYFNKK